MAEPADSDRPIRPRWPLLWKFLGWAGVNLAALMLLALLFGSLAQRQESLGLLYWCLAMISASLISGLLWAWFGLGFTRRLRDLQQATATIAEGRFDVRLDTQGGVD